MNDVFNKIQLAVEVLERYGIGNAWEVHRKEENYHKIPFLL
jgi:hypothetical protein